MLPFGVLEDIGIVKSDFFSEFVGLGKFGITFRTESSNNIRGQSDVWTKRANAIDQGTIFSIRIAAVHQAENAIATRLYGKMNMFTDMRMPRHNFEQARGEILRVWGCETHALDTRHIGDRCEQPCKVPTAKAIRIHVLPQKGDLLEPLSGDLLGFSNDSFWITRSFPSPCIRHHAKTTEIVASPHDGDPCIHPIVPIGDDVVVGFVL